VDRLRIHDLGHTAATRLMRNTRDMKLVAKYLGHTDIRTTARHLHPDDQDLAKAAESLVKSYQDSQPAKSGKKLALVSG